MRSLQPGARCAPAQLGASHLRLLAGQVKVLRRSSAAVATSRRGDHRSRAGSLGLLNSLPCVFFKALRVPIEVVGVSSNC
jgi:hypothetical protein